MKILFYLPEGIEVEVNKNNTIHCNKHSTEHFSATFSNAKDIHILLVRANKFKQE